MGCGSWTRDSYVSYSTTKGMSVSMDGMISGSYSNQDMFKAKILILHLILRMLLESVAIQRNIQIRFLLFLHLMLQGV